MSDTDSDWRSRLGIAIDALEPTQFENLVYDLLTSLGMRNATWRTPGADGGRDIEGYVLEEDFSGYTRHEKWYVECKRYASSINWPTIYEKLAYADSHDADVLMLCTQSTISPNAVTLVQKWNVRHKRPAIRSWPRAELLRRLAEKNKILLKYGLTTKTKSPAFGFSSLSLAASKAISSHAARLSTYRLPDDAMLLSAESLAELIKQRTEDLEIHEGVQPVFGDVRIEHTSLIEFKTADFRIDSYSFNALLYYLLSLLKSKLIITQLSPSSCQINCGSKAVEKRTLSRFTETIQEIAFWGNLELRSARTRLKVKQRNG